MQTMVLDFETAYDKKYSLSKMPYEEYINDERFEVIGFSIKLDSEPTQWHTGDKAYLTAVLSRFDWSSIILVAHNALFDGTILSLHYGIYPAKVLDTVAMARAVLGSASRHSLKALAEYYGLGEKGEEVIAAIGKHRGDFTAQELSAYGEYCNNDVELTYKLFHKLLPNFTMTELELINLTIKMATRPTLRADLPMMKQHLVDVVDAQDNLLRALGIDKKELVSNQKFAALLEAQGVAVPMKVSPANGKQTFAFAKTDDGLKSLLHHENPVVRQLVETRLGVKSAIEETRTSRFIGIAERMGKLPIPLNYYGAATGRWAAGGGQKVNFQNLPRGSKLKEAIIAPEGYVIVGADLSNIELRVGMLVAGETNAVKLLGDGGDLYKDFASKVFNVPYDEVDKDQRFIGKQSQLSLIFGVGSNKLRSAIKHLSGVDLGEVEAKRIVDLYRATYTGVVNFWSECDVAIKAISNNQFYEFRNGFAVVEGKRGIKFPSGLYMKYLNLAYGVDAKTGKRGYRYQGPEGPDNLYGGKGTNNFVQGLARCVMGEAMVRIAKRYNIVLTIHDSVYILAPEAEAEEALAFLIKEMTTPPAWMPDIPLDAEGGFGRSLKEAG